MKRGGEREREEYVLAGTMRKRGRERNGVLALTCVCFVCLLNPRKQDQISAIYMLTSSLLPTFQPSFLPSVLPAVRVIPPPRLLRRLMRCAVCSKHDGFDPSQRLGQNEHSYHGYKS